MSMNPRNILNLLRSAFSCPEYNIESAINDDERSFASHLVDLIKTSCDCRLIIESYDSLCFNDDSVMIEAQLINEEIDEDVNDSIEDEYLQVENEIDLEYKQKAVAFWRSGKKRKRRSFDSVKTQFKKVPNQNVLYRWEKQIELGGSRQDKLLKISQYVLEQFNIATDKHLPVHDVTLKKWALKARENVQLSYKLFKGSSKWVYNFKKTHGIVSRKINKFVTTAQLSNATELLEAGSKFVENIRSVIKKKGEANVYNSDQSGFNLEIHGGRTLSIKGTPKVECLAQSLHSLTHSYTIQPVIAADGKLHSPLLIVLQETNGKFGPIVEKNLYKAKNISVYASNSGKLTSSIAARWFEKDFLSIVDKNSSLLLDSWSGQTEKVFENTKKGNNIVKIHTIPPGVTGSRQPLDVYGFRPWKNFMKSFSDIILLYNFDINLHLRNNILKLQSLTHNQFSSPRFINMFKYAWWKSGYISNKPEKCLTPVQYCFQNSDTECISCNEIVVIKCAWCSKNLCIQHFFAVTGDNLPHYCEKYVE